MTFDKEKNKWRARVQIDKKTIHLGYYQEIQNAINAIVQYKSNLDFNIKTIQLEEEVVNV